MRYLTMALLMLLPAFPGFAKPVVNGVRFFNAVPGAHDFEFLLAGIPISQGTQYLKASKYVEVGNTGGTDLGVLNENGSMVTSLSEGGWGGRQTWAALHNGTGIILRRVPMFPNSDKKNSLLYVAHFLVDAGTITVTPEGGSANQITFGGSTGSISLDPGRHTVTLEHNGSTFFRKSFKAPGKGVTLILITGSVTDTSNPLSVTVISEKSKPVRLKDPPL